MEISLPAEASTVEQTNNVVEVSVVIPCLNEANSLAFCVDKAIRAFHSAGLSGEVVVADNGSTDGSIEIAGSHGARIVRVPERGYGAALQAGIAASRGRFIIMGDADDSYDFSDVPRFVLKWREGYDLVMGNRFQGGIRPGAMPWSHKYIGNPGLTALLNVLFRTGIGDSYCGLRGFSRAMYDRLGVRSTGMEFAPELIIKAAQIGARITEIPIVLWPDKRGRPPHLRSFRDILMLSLGLALVFWLLPGPRHLTPHIVLDVHTMVFGVIFTLMGAQIINIGFFAKVFSYAARFDRNPVSLRRLLRRVKLEHGLLAGFLMAAAGFAGSAHVAWQWAAGGFGPLEEGLREVLFWSMWLFLGVQTIFSSFFLSMLGISRGTYIGDYEDHE